MPEDHINRVGGWNEPPGVKADIPISKDLVYKEEKSIEWKSHPMNSRLKMRILLTNKRDGVKATFIRGHIPKGETVQEHTHDVHDILYPLCGKGKIWVEGVGDLELKKGVIVHVPPGVSHRLYDITEDLELLDVFSGPIM
jgi:quercetin dioxygenase-like cupin family protein